MNYDKELVTRFARFLMTNGQPDPSQQASRLVDAVRNNSAIVGKRAQLAWNNSGLTMEALKAEFNEDEISDIFTLPLGDDPNYDYTKASRSRRRREILDGKAKALGFESLSTMLTQWKNGDVKIMIIIKEGKRGLK